MNLDTGELQINSLRAENVPWKIFVFWPVDKVTHLVLPRHIITEISRQSKFSSESLLGRRKDLQVGRYRQMVYLLIRETQPGMSLVDIARIFDRDHTTVLFGIRVARERVVKSAHWRRIYLRACERLEISPTSVLEVKR